jgi:hypothetical protein
MCVKERIEKAVVNANNIEEVKTLLLDVLKKVREEGAEKIGYVAGIITSEGPENIDRNVKRLAGFADSVCLQSNFPIFSSTYLITDALFEKLGMQTIAQADWQKFWRDVLSSGFITDIFMTPRWEISYGSCDEHKTAQEVGMKIHYLTKEI